MIICWLSSDPNALPRTDRQNRCTKPASSGVIRPTRYRILVAVNTGRNDAGSDAKSDVMYTLIGRASVLAMNSLANLSFPLARA